MMFDAYNTIFTQIDYTTTLGDKELLIVGQYINYDGIGAMRWLYWR